MSQKGQLPNGAYGFIKGSEFKPYVSASTSMKEVTVLAVIIGFISAIIFSMSNVYLGLKTGITIAAGIPSGILGVGILKALKRNTVLQDNVIQSMGSAGESVAGGVIFTIPAILLWGGTLDGPTILKIFILLIAGSALGVFILSVFRRFLLEDEHGSELKFPESIAISEVIVNGSDGEISKKKGESSGFKLLILGTVIGGVFKLVGQGLGFIKESVSTRVWNTQIGVDIFPALMGLGYIVGRKIATTLWAGGLISWFLLIPMIHFFGNGVNFPLAPATNLISTMGAGDIWNSYIRYIGAGAVTTAGFIALLRTLPSIIRSFGSSLALKSSKEESGEKLRSRKETPISIVIAVLVVSFLIIWLMPMVSFKTSPLLALVVVFAIFFFGIVSARLCGVIGVSNNPVSGMTIASLLLITTIVKLTGHTDQTGMFLCIFLGSAVATGIAIAGGYAQSLKVGFILGGTSRKLTTLMFLSSIIAILISIFTLALMQKAYGIGSAAAPAPQGTLMRVLVEGIIGGNLPWDLIIIGAFISIIAFVLGLPMMLIAIGTYLPIGLTSAIFIGGLVSAAINKINSKNKEALDKSNQMATVFSSGLIAGDAIFGIILASLTAFGININLFSSTGGFLGDTWGTIFSIFIFLLLAGYIIRKFNYSKKIE